jgi:putative transposase
MPRTARAAVGGFVYHALNRGNGRQCIFRKAADYIAFVAVLIEGLKHCDIRVFAYCLMPNHWHLVLIPRSDHDLARYLSWITNTHVKRYRAHYRNTSGHLYQGRFKSFVVQDDRHLVVVLRYVEANALRAGLVRRAEDWSYSSLGCDPRTAAALISDWPIDRPRNWTEIVNQAIGEKQLSLVRESINRGRPFGEEEWVLKMVRKLGLNYTLRLRGRPRKA